MNTLSSYLMSVWTVLCLTLLLRALSRRERSVTLRTTACLALFLALLPLQRNSPLPFSLIPRDGPYVQLAVRFLLYAFFIRVYMGGDAPSALRIAAVYLLLSDYADIVLSFFSQRTLGEDIFVAQPSARQLEWLLMYAVLLGVLTLVVARVEKHQLPSCISPLQILLTGLATLPYLFFRGIIIWLPLTNEQLSAETPVMLTVSMLLGVVLILGIGLVVSGERHQMEINQMNRLMALQREQLLSNQQNAERVNQRYHDLRNMLVLLRDEGNGDTHRELSDMLEQLSSYEDCLHTGSHAVDTIMGEKLELCRQNGIGCVPYINGELLQAIKPLDLCVLFGNAMDNAIEACCRQPEGTERCITVRTTHQGAMLLIRFENTCADRPHEQDGHLVTSKADRESHGIGMHSMQAVAQSYGGQLSWRYAQGWFVLDIFLTVS